MMDTIDWLSEETREKAKEKLSQISIHAVYPDVWEDDSMFSVIPAEDGGTLIQAITDYTVSRRQQKIDLINTEVNPDIWGINILDANAYYTTENNSINIIAGFLCDRTYRTDMSTEEKYGILGTVIGHEISHAFDTNGAQFDGNGNLVNWWTEEDYRTFSTRADKLVQYYNRIVMFDDGTPCQGQMVQTEAIADMAGLKCVLKMAENIENFDYDLFFRSYADLWAMSGSLEFIQHMAAADVHPLYYLRCNVSVQQFDEFYDTYGITEEDGMYLAPEERIAVW